MSVDLVKYILVIVRKVYQLPEGNYGIQHTYAGCWQKDAGAWSWCLTYAGVIVQPLIGSKIPASKLVMNADQRGRAYAVLHEDGRIELKQSPSQLPRRYSAVEK